MKPHHALTLSLVVLVVGLAVVVLAGGGRTSATADEKPPTAAPGATMVKVRLIGADGSLGEPVYVPKVVKTDEEWQKQLSPEQYRITRGKGTERAFCGGLLKEKNDGVFACVCCALPLFETKAKFESGTGWPSFFQPIAPENMKEERDVSHGMVRVEILCPRCDAHMGHVFDDGPRPTGLRYCLNSESLRFVAEADRKSLAEVAPPQPVRAEIVLAGGCFWCVEAVFEEIDGGHEAVSGYAGGSAETANYKAVCEGNTGHAEVVKIVYDPAKVKLEDLLKIHFATHDPTTLNRQGNDAGTQYRSAVFYSSDAEKALIEAFLADLTAAKVFTQPIVTTVEPLAKFFPAEAYHQGYAACNPGQPYVRAIALPKVAKVREKFKDKLKPAGSGS